MPDRALVGPTTSLHAAWQEAHAEWGPGQHEDGFGLWPEDDVESAAGFAAWVRRLRAASDPAVPPGPGRSRTSYWWITEGDTVAGGIALRHQMTARVREIGHVGYGVRPSARGRGLATWALGQVLAEAAAAGLERVLVVCEDDNAASARVVERHGGRLEEVRDGGPVRLRRYWVDLADR